LSYKHKSIPGIWAWLLLLAGPAYTFISLDDLLGWVPTAQMATLEMVLAIPMTLSELCLAIVTVQRS
jgi:hypothetical protein